MKKNIIYLIATIVISVAAWISCTNTESSKTDDGQSSSDTTYLLLSQLAFKSYITNDTANIKEAKALYLAAQDESQELAGHLNLYASSKDASAPNPAVASPTIASFVPANNSLAVLRTSGKADLCPCPNSTQLCPCPGLISTVLFATQSSDAKVSIDNGELKETTIAGTTDVKWKAISLADVSTNRQFKLTITADFAGTTRTYILSMEVRDGKLFMIK